MPSLKVIEAISNEFNISYQEIIGGKMMTDAQHDKLIIEIENLKEYGSWVLSQYAKFLDRLQISRQDENNHLVAMFYSLSDKINSELYSVESFDELAEIRGFVQFAKQMMEADRVRVA